MVSNGVTGELAHPFKGNINQKSSIVKLERDLLERTPREDYYFQGDSTLSAIFRIFKVVTEEYPKVAAEDDDNVCFAISRSNRPPLQISAEDLGLRGKTSREQIKELVTKWTPEAWGKYFEAVTANSSKGLEADTVIILQPKQFPTIHKRSLFLQFFGDTIDNLLKDELRLFYVACSRAKRRIYFLPETSHMQSEFLEQISNRIKNPSWQSYPCRLSSPELYKISVQNNINWQGDLLKATDILLTHGLEKFSRPDRIATRSKLIRSSRKEALKELKLITESCKEYDLRYFITDGINKEIFRLPGPKSILEAISEC